MVSLVISVLSLLLGVTLACVDPNCDREDCGSFGNAGCNMKYFFEGRSSKETMQAMTAVLSNGGPDGRYTLQTTAEGTTGFADLTPYNASVDYIGQAYHVTESGTYTDTVDMTIATSSSGSGSYVQMFSISQIGGAYCDSGQNYKNVITVILALDWTYDEINLYGCSPQ